MTDDLDATRAEPPASHPAGAPEAAQQPAPPDLVANAVVTAGSTAAPAAAPPAPVPPQKTAPVPPQKTAPVRAAPRGRSVLGAARSISVGVLFVLSCLSLLLATTTWWLHDRVLSTDRFVALTGPLARDAAVQEALTEATTEQLDQALDLGPIGRYVVSGVAGEVYASDQFAAIWERLMRALHTQVVAFLRDEGSIASLEDGELVLNLFPVMAAVAEQVNALGLAIGDQAIRLPVLANPDDAEASRAELEVALGRPLGPTFGVVEVGATPRLEAAQRYVALFDALVVALLAITVGLAVLTLVVTRQRLPMMSLLAVGGLATLLAARLIVSSATDAIAAEIAAGGPGAIIGGEAIQLVAESYRAFARGILLVGLVVAIGGTTAAWLLERRTAGTTGGPHAPSLADGWFLALAGLCASLVALLALGLTTLSLAVVGVAYIVWLVVVVLARWSEHGLLTA